MTNKMTDKAKTHKFDRGNKSPAKKGNTPQQ